MILLSPLKYGPKTDSLRTAALTRTTDGQGR